MTETWTADICVIGAGSAGLTVAAGASQMGADSVLVERGAMGGDCLNYGCVPSKSLLAAAKAATLNGTAHRMGVRFEPPTIDFSGVHGHVHDVIATIAPHDSQERYEGLGVRVIRDTARFVGPREIEAGGTRVRARRFVVATGSKPFVPPLPGLDEVDYLTNETVFALSELPEHLIVIGGGPIGCELSQAFRRLGAQVSLVEMASLLPNDDPELVDVVRTPVRRYGAGLTLEIERNGARETLSGSALLVAVGRQPAIEDMDLEAAGIAYDRRGIQVDGRLRTTNPKAYAAGDVAGGYQFTHIAGYHAGVVLKNALFRLPAKADSRAVPWVTYTEPELAQVGMSEAAARDRHAQIRVLRWPFAENDRARCEHQDDGFVKVVTTARGRILGASMVGPHAGELIQPWILALSKGLNIGAVAQMIAPYPTLGEVNKRAAGSFYTPGLFSARTRAVVRFLAKFG
jgi:pyruvate/2-oxoglutarate dehydrogenase complex dihydrolipoamide dehydrogenase (E3) component